MPNEVQVKAIVGVVLAITAVVFVINGVKIAPELLHEAFSYSVTGLLFSLLIWERWAWAWRVFRPWMTTRPDVRGTWEGVIHSNYVDPDTKKTHNTINVYLVIRQTYSSVDVRLFSNESSSLSLSAHLHSDNVDLYTLAVTYRNTPTVLRRARSPISHGGMLLSVRGNDPVLKLDGEYWTDRATMGEIALTKRKAQLAGDFDSARDLF